MTGGPPSGSVTHWGCACLALGLDSLPEAEGAPSHGKPWRVRHGPSGSPQPIQLDSWAPGDRKVSEVGRAARWGREGLREEGLSGDGEGGKPGSREEESKGPSPWLPAQIWMPALRPAQDPLYDVPNASGRQAGGPQRPGRVVSLRERLLLTRPVWLQLQANAAAALHVLRTEPPGVSLAPNLQGLASQGWEGEGWDAKVLSCLSPIHLQTFLVRKSNTRHCQALCMRLPEASGPSFVSSHYILESPGGEGLAWQEGAGRREVP